MFLKFYGKLFVNIHYGILRIFRIFKILEAYTVNEVHIPLIQQPEGSIITGFISIDQLLVIGLGRYVGIGLQQKIKIMYNFFQLWACPGNNGFYHG